MTQRVNALGTSAPSKPTLSRRHVLAGVATVAVGLTAFGVTRAASEPRQHVNASPALPPFDDLMTEFAQANDVPGCALAVAKAGRLVYARGFGKLSVTNDAPVSPTTRFRIASISKPITAVGVLRLVERGQIDLDRPVLDYMPADGLLMGRDVAVADERWRHVTVRHCLQHRSGMDRGKSGEPIVMFKQVRERFGLEYPVGPEAVVAFALGRPLDADPGERYAYSNVGYLILGRIIERVSGTPYATYIEREVLKPLGISRMALGRALPEHRPPDEAGYLDRASRTVPCIYPPRVGERVPLLDGGFNLEAYEAHGGWIASAVDLVRFAAAFDDPAACPLLSRESIAAMFGRPTGAPPEPVHYGCGWSVRTVAPGKINTWHTGLLKPGTSTILVRRWDGLNWAALFNADANPAGQELAALIDPLLHRAAGQVERWPDVDLFDEYGA